MCCSLPHQRCNDDAVFGIYCGRWKIFFDRYRTICPFYAKIYVYIDSTKKWISFLFFVQTRFSRGLFCSFLSAWLFHPFQYFFRIPVWLSTFLLSRSSRVFARSTLFTSFLPRFLLSFLFFSFLLFLFPRLTLMSALPSSKSNTRPRVTLSVYSSRAGEGDETMLCQSGRRGKFMQIRWLRAFAIYMRRMAR